MFGFGQTKQVHILGAGPAGLAAAIALAKAGREVHVHERYETSGKRFQGDLQGLENWTEEEDVLKKLQEFGIDLNFEATPFHEVELTDGKRSFRKRSSKPLFYLVKRGKMSGSLDTGLRLQTEALGVQIHYRSVRELESVDIVATGPIRQSVVAADKGVVFKTDLPNMAVAIFHDDLAYLGYSYLLVVQGYGCLCTVVFKDLHLLNSCFERTVELMQKKYPLDLTAATPVGGIGSFCLNQPKQIGDRLHVGEAAGFQDLLWGFGIRTALTSGYLAAQSVLNDLDYTQLTEKRLESLLKASIVNRYLWEKVKVRKLPLIPFLMLLPIPLRKQFKCLYNFTWMHRMLYPMAKRYVERQYDKI